MPGGELLSRAYNDHNRKVERERERGREVSSRRTGLRLPVVMPDGLDHPCLRDPRDLGEIPREKESEGGRRGRRRTRKRAKERGNEIMREARERAQNSARLGFASSLRSW